MMKAHVYAPKNLNYCEKCGSEWYTEVEGKSCPKCNNKNEKILFGNPEWKKRAIFTTNEGTFAFQKLIDNEWKTVQEGTSKEMWNLVYNPAN